MPQKPHKKDKPKLHRIVCDPRVGSKEIHAIIPAEMRDMRMLPFGDFALTVNGPHGAPIPVGVERKTLGDLVQSMTNGRLADHQLPGLLENYEQVYVLIEGGYRKNQESGVIEEWGELKSACGFKRKPGKKRGGRGWKIIYFGGKTFSYDAVENFLTSLTIMAGVKIKHTQGPYETKDWLVSLCKWGNKKWEEHKSLSGLYSKEIQEYDSRTGKREEVTLAVRVAAQFPGIGAGKARLAGKKFGSVRDMVRATEQEWMEIEGVGEMVARSVKKAIRGDK